MSTGQVFLTLAALVLLAIISMNINQMYVQSVNSTVDAQMTSDAINFGKDISERLQSYAFMYDELDDDFGGLDDVEDEDKRLSTTSQIGRTFHATVELSSEQVIEHGESGRIATIRVFEEIDQDFEMKAELVTTVTDLSE